MHYPIVSFPLVIRILNNKCSKNGWAFPTSKLKCFFKKHKTHLRWRRILKNWVALTQEKLSKDWCTNHSMNCYNGSIGFPLYYLRRVRNSTIDLLREDIVCSNILNSLLQLVKVNWHQSFWNREKEGVKEILLMIITKYDDALSIFKTNSK